MSQTIEFNAPSRDHASSRPIGVGSIVSVRYRLVDADTGEVLEERGPDAEPYTYQQGSEGVIRGLQMLLEGRRAGERLTATIPPEHAFGTHKRTFRVPRRLADRLGVVRNGDLVELTLPDGTFEAEVRAIHDNVVVFRTTGRGHPLEKVTLKYDPLEIVAVEDARPEELEREGLVFPFDLFAIPTLPGDVGQALAAVSHLCLFPPYPWGQWLYARLFERFAATLPGDVVEMGVARGGMSLFLGALAKAKGKRVFSFDSFIGLPPPNAAKDNPYYREGDYAPRHGDLLERFRADVHKHDLDETVVPVKGFFADTVPAHADNRYSFVHLDSDLYESMMTSLRHAWPRTSDGGVVVIDDFFHPAMGPRRAAADFFKEIGEEVVYHVSFPYTAFVIKGERPGARRASVDGLVYSLEWLRSDTAFIEAVKESVRRMRGVGGREATNARDFLELLQDKVHRSSDIFAYFRVMETFWDSMIADASWSANKALTRV
ncbi:MAG: TylF/MycF/NovP-related O-methyltransferase [Polyangiaceae bacterium]